MNLYPYGIDNEFQLHQIDNNTYHLEYIIPGFEKNEISITMLNGILKIQGNSKKYGKINYKISLLDDVEVVDAILKLGILTIVLKQITTDELKYQIKIN